MSSFSRVFRAIIIGTALLVPLAGCTGLRPVYSDEGLGTQSLAVSYPDPTNRLEQIIYQDLALRLGKSSGAVPVVSVRASSRSSALTSGKISSPFAQRQMTVTARFTVTAPDGTVLFSGTRAQSADYTTSAQASANEQASDSAAANAARLLADTIRLQVYAALQK